MTNEPKTSEEFQRILSVAPLERVRADAGKALHHLLLRREKIPWDHMVLMWEAALARWAIEDWPASNSSDFIEPIGDKMPDDLVQSMGYPNASLPVAVSYALSSAMRNLKDPQNTMSMIRDELKPWLTDESWRKQKWGSLEDIGFVRIQVLDRDDTLLGYVAESNEFVSSLISQSDDAEDNPEVGDWYAYFVDSLSFARQLYWMGTHNHFVNSELEPSGEEEEKITEFFYHEFGSEIDAVSLADSIIHAEYDTEEWDLGSIEMSYDLAKAAPEQVQDVFQALDIFFVQVPQRAYGKITSKPTEPGYMGRQGYLPCLAIERAIRLLSGALEATANKSHYPSKANLLLARLYHMKARLLISEAFIQPWQEEAEEAGFETPAASALSLLDKALAIYQHSEHSDSSKPLSPQELRIEIDRTVAQSLSSSISETELKERYRFMEKSASDIDDRELSDSIELNEYQFTLQGEDRMRMLTKFLEDRSEDYSEWTKLMCEYLISFDTEFAPSVLQRIETLRQLEKLDPIRASSLNNRIFTALDGLPAHEVLFKQMILEVSTINEEAKQGMGDGIGVYQAMPESFIENLYDHYLHLVSFGICQDHNYRGKVSSNPSQLSYGPTFGSFFGSRFDKETHQACVRVLRTPRAEFSEVFGTDPYDHDTRRTMMRFAGLALLLNSKESPELESVEKFAGQDKEENYWDEVLSLVLQGRINECYEATQFKIRDKLVTTTGLKTKGDQGPIGFIDPVREDIDEPTDALDYILLELVDPGRVLADYDVSLQSLEEWSLFDTEHDDLKGAIDEDEVENYATILTQFRDLVEVSSSLVMEELETQDAISRIGEIQKSIKDLDSQGIVHSELLEEVTDEAGISKLQESVHWRLMAPSVKANELTRLRHHITHLLTFVPWARQWPASLLLARAISNAIRDVINEARKLSTNRLVSLGIIIPLLDLCSCIIYVTPDEDDSSSGLFMGHDVGHGHLYQTPEITPDEYRKILLYLEELAELEMSRDIQEDPESEVMPGMFFNTSAYYYVAIKYRRFTVFEEDIFDEDMFRVINEIDLNLIAGGVSKVHGYSADEIATAIAQAIADRDDAEELISNIDLDATTKFESEGHRFSQLILDNFESIRENQ